MGGTRRAAACVRVRVSDERVVFFVLKVVLNATGNFHPTTCHVDSWHATAKSISKKSVQMWWVGFQWLSRQMKHSHCEMAPACGGVFVTCTPNSCSVSQSGRAGMRLAHAPASLVGSLQTFGSSPQNGPCCDRGAPWRAPPTQVLVRGSCLLIGWQVNAPQPT